MARHEVNYNALANEPRSNPFVVQPMPTEGETTEDDAHVTDTDNEDTPRDNGLMIHVVPDTSKARWNHIEDLDSFFTRMYNYHQKHGFAVMMLQEFFELGQFVFVVCFVVFLCYGVNYPVLFGEQKTDFSKIKINDAVYSPDETLAAISGWSWLMLSITLLFWVFRTIKVLYHAVQYWDVKKFYNTALKIDDDELDNLTWHEVQRRIRDVQSEQQMCIHKEHLTELDIYHRILRFKNYMVAMMNKNLIPAKICVPVLGECVIFSRGLRYNIELILFRGPWSPFENNWHLKEEFKRANRRNELAQKLSRQIAWIALAHFLLSPLIFLWALMVFFFSYADLIKREPGTLGTRCWSQYGMLYMRHFNELDHELNARLNRAYRPAVKYMNTFSSPLMAVIAGNVVFICGGVLSVLIMLTIYDEDVVQVEHVFTIISALTAMVVISRVFIPDENLIFCPEQLMTAVLAHTHYLPITWRGLAHTTRVRGQFGQFFQFRFTHLLNELLSPLITPYVLMFYFRPRALDLVDFFRNFTVAVVGVGDVCSFAQMDVRKHGNPDWQPTHSTTDPIPDHVTPVCETNQYTQGEHGKTELSLMHFTLTNPGWKMPQEARQFVHGIRRHAMHDLDAQQHRNEPPATGATATTGGSGGGHRPTAATAMEQSLYMLNSMGGEYASMAQSVMINTQHRVFGTGTGQMQTSSQCSYGLRNPFAGDEPAQPQPAGQQRATASYDFQHMLNQNMSMMGAAEPPESFDGSSTPMRSVSGAGVLHDIDEHAEDATATAGARHRPGSNAASFMAAGGGGGGVRSQSARPTLPFNQSMLGASMGASTVGGQSRREGPNTAGLPDSGLLLHSVVFRQSEGGETGLAIGGVSGGAHHPTEVTATDMCLSTLYLHELHHRQIRRRGFAAGDARQSAHQWQRPHQLQSQSQRDGGAIGMVNVSRSQSSASFDASPLAVHLSMVTTATSGTPAAVENTPLLGGAKKS